MALPETNITTASVGTAIGSASRNVGVLCTASSINQWSKKKPVRQHGSPNWWEYTAANVLYSILTSPLTNGLDDLAYTADSFWTYLRPRGDYGTYPLEGFRLGDFRGYEHTSVPTINVNTYPSGNIRGLGSQAWNQIINTASAGITVSDMGISTYYFGILIEWGASWENKYVQTVASTLASGAVAIPFDYHITPFSSSYTGDYRWTAFISSQEITNGEAERWQTLSAAQAAHTGEVIIITPAQSTGISGLNKGTFNNNLSIVPSSTTINISWEWKSQGSITVNVTPDAMATTSVAGDTGDGIFITVIAGATATGDYTLTVQASSENTTGLPRSCKVTITDTWGEATPVVITITQMANPV